MGNFPTLQAEDFREFDAAMKELLGRTEADFAVLIEKAGYCIHVAGETGGCDTTSLASLVAGAYMATGMFTALLKESHQTAMYQQGEKVSTLVLDVDEACLLLMVFRSQRSVGAMKFYARETVRRLAAHLEAARRRAPDRQLDLATLNPADIGDLFQRGPSRS